MMDAAGTHEIQRDFGTQGASPRTIAAPVHLFHYHLVTSRVREVEARYIGKLGFDLVARHGRIGDDLTSYEPGVSWAELDELGFKLRLSEIELGAVNVVVQPGQWPLPRVDHLGLALDEDEFEATLERAQDAELRVQEHGGRRTFVSTNAGYRLELHPPRDWIDELLVRGDRLQLAELHLRADDPHAKARALAELLDCERDGSDVEVGDTLVRFVPGGPQGRPELHGEAFVVTEGARPAPATPVTGAMAPGMPDVSAGDVAASSGPRPARRRAGGAASRRRPAARAARSPASRGRASRARRSPRPAAA